MRAGRGSGAKYEFGFPPARQAGARGWWDTQSFGDFYVNLHTFNSVNEITRLGFEMPGISLKCW